MFTKYKEALRLCVCSVGFNKTINLMEECYRYYHRKQQINLPA